MEHLRVLLPSLRIPWHACIIMCCLAMVSTPAWAQTDAPPDPPGATTDQPPDAPELPKEPAPKTPVAPPPVIIPPTPSKTTPAPTILPVPDQIPPPEEEEEEIVISVEQYLDAPVITASKKVEKTAEAPAIVSVITSDDIEEMAPETLYDILGTIPGVEIMETYYGYTSVTFRGVLQTHYNDKSLMLVNGTPLYDTINFSYYLEQMPMNAIKQIEVIRGPGSTLYGTNAFAGVINMIPFDGTNCGKTKIYARYGRFNTIDVGFSGGFSKGPFSAFLSASRKDSSGYPFKIDKDEFGQSGEPVYAGDRDAYEDDYQNVYANMKLYDFALSMNYFSMDKDKYGLIPALLTTGERTMTGMFVDARYDFKISKMFNLTPLAWFNYMQKEEDLGWYPPALWAKYGFTLEDPNDPKSARIPNDPLDTTITAATRAQNMLGGPEYQKFSGFKTGTEIRSAITPFDMLQLDVGMVFEYTYMKDYRFYYSDAIWGNLDGDAADNEFIFDPGREDKTATAIADSHNTYDMSGYLQGTFRVQDWLGILAGLRYNYNKDTKHFLAPRGGIVLTLLEDLHAKILYGRAFRSPSFFEKFVLTQKVLYGGNISFLDRDTNTEYKPKLDAEQVDTIDVGFDWILAKAHSLRLNYFFLTTGNMIDRKLLPGTNVTINGVEQTGAYPHYENLAGYWITGWEFEYRTSPTRGMKAYVNMSYRIGRSKEESLEDKKLYYFAPFLANLGVSYKWLDLVPWLRTSLYGQFISKRSGPLAKSGEIEIDPYFLLGMNVAAEINRYMELSLITHNLLNMKYAYPEYIRKNVAEVPGGPPISVFGKMTLKF